MSVRFGETRATGETRVSNNRMDSTISPAPVHGEGVLVFGHSTPKASGFSPSGRLPETPPRKCPFGLGADPYGETAGGPYSHLLMSEER